MTEYNSSENFFEIGRIVNTQGIKGELRVIPTTDDPSRFKLLDFAYVEMGSGSKKVMRLMHLENIWFHKQFVIVKFEEIKNMTEAEKYKTATVKIPPEMALPLDEGQFYIRDILGMEVITCNGERLGVVHDVIQTGANDVYVVSGGASEVLIPAIKQCIKYIDVPNRRMTVELLEGLL